MTQKHTRLGDVLVTQGAITRETLEHEAFHARGRLGHYLRAYNHIDDRALAKALAAQWELEYVEFDAHVPNASLFLPREREHYIRHHYVPFARSKSGLVIATSQPSDELKIFAAAYHLQPITMVVTSPRDLAAYHASVASLASTRHATLHLRRQHRHLSADRILLRNQRRGFVLLALALGAVFTFDSGAAWHGLLVACNIFYLATLALKMMLYHQGKKGLMEQQKNEASFKETVATLDHASLPIYTILLPLYQESSAVLERLIAHLNALDYPHEKLDIKLICEADDMATIEALKELQPPQMMEIIHVPPSQPRTKPKACNMAIPHFRGEFIVIFDAEDAPAPDQLKRAVAMFQATPTRVACLQAPLNYYNRQENLLTQLFSIEYSSLFNLLLPALQRIKLPIPLGGTSNHLRAEALRTVGGWDAFNVTEDADLGIRLAYFGFETRVLPSLTLEEAPVTVRAWMSQRTRWIKGYIQTWLVFTRDTGELKKRLGKAGYYGFQFFVGAPALTFLLAPLFWVIFAFSLTGLLPTHLSPLMVSLCFISFVGGMLSHWIYARATIRLEGWQSMGLAMAAYPLYWLLHSVAAARALYQLVVAPHHWNKTTHGISRIFKG